MDILRYLLVFVLILSLSAGASAATKSGAIWTTLSACGDIEQNANHYAVGDAVYVHGENFDAGTHAWTIAGLPGGASADPGQVVAEGVIDGTSFCFAAYIVQPGDDGEYKVSVDRKHDNYRVEGRELTCEEAVGLGLLTGEIDGTDAIVENGAGQAFTVTLASYAMHAPTVEDQSLFDADTQDVAPGETVSFAVDAPLCAYQLDLVCGDPIVPPFYDVTLDSEIVLGQEFCVWEPTASSGSLSAQVAVADAFPQDGDYVLVCEANGFSPTTYNWFFGDGEYAFNRTVPDVFHTYDPGAYTVACKATDGTDWAVGALDIAVS